MEKAKSDIKSAIVELKNEIITYFEKGDQGEVKLICDLIDKAFEDVLKKK